MKMGCSIASCTSYGCSTSPVPAAPAAPAPAGPSATRRARRALLAALCFLLSPLAVFAQDEDGSDVIRLRPRGEEAAGEPAEAGDGSLDELRRGFDYNTFEARLESLWFQRQALMGDGRDSETSRLTQQIRAYCTEEGVRRLEYMASALVAEAQGLMDEGRYPAALDSLELAEFFDSGRPQIRLARAEIFWKSGRGFLASARELIAGGREALVQSARDFSLFNQLGIVLVVALLIAIPGFGVLMVLRYQVPFRHEIEEWIDHSIGDRWATLAGWAVLGAPLLLWVGAGWCAVFWIVVLFRFMNRSERIAALMLLIAGAVSVPAFHLGVRFYGMTVDPLVRATLAAADGEYNPDRVIKLQRLVDAHPQQSTYRFLLAGLYRNARYFEDAFQEYKTLLKNDPSNAAVKINIANIFYITGQYPEATAYYREALDIEPGNLLAWFNLHLAQSEMFRFKEAEESLMMAREIDPSGVAALLSEAGERGNRTAIRDAAPDTASVWDAAMGGRGSRERSPQDLQATLLDHARNPVSIVFAVGLVGCIVLGWPRRSSRSAKRCIRCGSPFCHYCKSSRDGHEYCSQCLHLFVLGDGLAPEAKRQKLYEIERHERRGRLARRLLSFVFPGSSQVLRGRSGRGMVILTAWIFAVVLAWPVVLAPLERGLGVSLGLTLLGASGVPASHVPNPVAMLGGLALVLLWVAGNARRGRRAEA